MKIKEFVIDSVKKYLILSVIFSIIIILTISNLSDNLINSGDMFSKEMGLDGNFLKDIFSFSVSVITMSFPDSGRKVSFFIESKLNNTIWYILSICLFSGVFLKKRNKTVAFSVFPVSVTAVILLIVFSRETGLFPVDGYTSSNYESFGIVGKIWDRVYHLILPLLSVIPFLIFVRTIILSKIRSFSTAYIIPFIIGSVVITENIFLLPGAGYAMIRNINNGDILMSVRILWSILILDFMMDRGYSLYRILSTGKENNEA